MDLAIAKFHNQTELAQSESLLKTGLKVLAKMTQEEFEGLKLILWMILEGDENKCQKDPNMEGIRDLNISE